MNIPIMDIFPVYEPFSGDIYVADYTEQTQNARKLEFFREPPLDIDYFHLINRQSIQVYGVNFEHNPSFVAGHPMCECLFTPQTANNKPWVMLMEMKYCEVDNVDTNALDAFIKLKHAYKYLCEEKQIINPAQHNIYLVVSIPNHSDVEPFDGFRGMQTESLASYDDINIKVFANNTILIATPNYLISKKTPVNHSIL